MKSNTSAFRSMFARLVAWMLCAVYVLFSIGIVKATHLCMGREASVSYFTANAEKCPCSLFAKEKDDCCNDEQDLLKIEDSQKSLSSFILSTPALTCVGEIYSALAESGATAVQVHSSASDTQPPPKSLFKIHCSFVFYG